MAGSPQPECTDVPADPPAAGAQAAFAQARAEHPDRPLAALHEALRLLAAPGSGSPDLTDHVGWVRPDLRDRTLLPQTVQYAQDVREGIASLLRDARTAGDLGPEIDVDGLARAVHVAQQGSIMVWATSGRGPLAASLERDVEVVLAPHRR